jgi:hypothetical protein
VFPEAPIDEFTYWLPVIADTYTKVLGGSSQDSLPTKVDVLLDQARQRYKNGIEIRLQLDVAHMDLHLSGVIDIPPGNSSGLAAMVGTYSLLYAFDQLGNEQLNLKYLECFKALQKKFPES